MRLATILVLVLGVLGCRPLRSAAPAAAAFEHHRDDYSTATRPPLPTEAELFAALARSSAAQPAGASVVLDDRLGVMATELSERSRSGERLPYIELVELARDAGSPLFPVLTVALAPDQPLPPDWSDVVVARVPGRGPLAIGIHAPADGPTILVFARAFIQLTSPVPRRGAKRFEFQLHPIARAFTPKLSVVTADGIASLPIVPVGDGRYLAERDEGFDGTLVGIFGITPRPSGGAYANKDNADLFAAVRFADAPMLTSAVEDLPGAIASLRARWKLPPLEIADGEATPCGPNVVTIAGRLVTQDQRCVTWTSAGADDERWRSVLANPLAIEAIAGASWQLAEIRRDPMTTTIRVARAFEDVSVDEARGRLSAALRERWPGIRHDADADRIALELATTWSSEPLTEESIAKVGERCAAAAARWAAGSPSYRLAWSDQDLAKAFELLQPHGVPSAYTLGVVRGTGPEGEPRWYVVVLLALPAA